VLMPAVVVGAVSPVLDPRTDPVDELEGER
jgi:hypothetical protein